MRPPPRANRATRNVMIAAALVLAGLVGFWTWDAHSGALPDTYQEVDLSVSGMH